MIRLNGNKVEEYNEQVEREWTLREAQDKLAEIQSQIADIENMKQRRLTYLNNQVDFLNSIIALF